MLKVLNFIDNDSYISNEEFEKAFDIELREFLKINNLVQRHYLQGYNCQKCEELCDLSIQRVAEKIFVDCPTGYTKKLFLDPKDVNGYRFSRSFLIAELKRNFNLSNLDINSILGFEILGSNQDRSIIFIFRENLTEAHDLILQDIKKKLDCKSLYVFVSLKVVRDDVFYKLSSENIFIYSLEELILSKSFELPEQEYFMEKPTLPLEAELEVFLVDRNVIYKKQKVVFGNRKKLFQWFHHLIMKPDKGYNLKEIADSLQGGILSESNIRTNRSRILDLFKQQTNINHSEIDSLIFYSSDCFKLCLKPEQIKIFDAELMQV